MNLSGVPASLVFVVYLFEQPFLFCNVFVRRVSMDVAQTTYLSIVIQGAVQDLFAHGPTYLHEQAQSMRCCRRCDDR